MPDAPEARRFQNLVFKFFVFSFLHPLGVLVFWTSIALAEEVEFLNIRFFARSTGGAEATATDCGGENPQLRGEAVIVCFGLL